MLKLILSAMLLGATFTSFGQTSPIGDTARARLSLHHTERTLREIEVRLGYIDTTVVSEQEFRDNVAVGLRIVGPHSPTATISEFTIMIIPRGGDYVAPMTSKSDRYTPDMLLWFKRIRKGDKVFFYDIKVNDNNHTSNVKTFIITLK